MQRSLESLFIVLMLGVSFSVLTSAVHNLYSSSDLPFLLSLPVAPVQVFFLKVSETYMQAAMMPAMFTLPMVVAVGLERQANLSYYPIALAAILALYAIPVALGSLLALILMRIAPVGKVKEFATGLSVFLAALLVVGMRILRPEQIASMSPAELIMFLRRFASFEIGWLPSSWASQAVWGALEGRFTPGAFLLAAASLFSLWLIALLAAFAYREGWIRALDNTSPRLDPSFKKAPWWEKFLARYPYGGLIAKDIRLLLRDPSQWSQLLVLLAIAGVYLISVSSVIIEGSESQRYRDAVGTLNIAVIAFLLSGIGIRMAYPMVSLEGEGFWLLRTGPLKSRDIVLSKFWQNLPLMLLLGGTLGFAAVKLIDVSPSLAFVSPLAALSAATVMTALGIGLGAAFPRFNATSPSEVPMAAGGLLYMALSLAYSLAITVLLAFPAWQVLRDPSVFYWSSPQGGWVLLALGLFTLLATVLPLVFGSYRLARYE
ncbi:MAG: hypothetical protein R2865_10950 [Deinococcales bacterium]